jgi:hypothetical protein
MIASQSSLGAHTDAELMHFGIADLVVLGLLFGPLAACLWFDDVH